MAEEAGKGVDIEKIVKFASETGRNYYLTILAVLVDWRTQYAGGRAREQTPDAVLTAMDGRTYSFVAINVFLALTCFIAAVGSGGKTLEVSIALVVPIFVVWTALAAALHLIAKWFGSNKPFLETLAVCMRVLSLALLVAAAVTLTVTVLLRPFLSQYDPRLVAGVSFLGIQTLFLAVYLPAGMRRVHGGSVYFHATIALFIVTWTLIANKAIIEDPTRVPMTAPPGERSPTPTPIPSPTLSPTPTQSPSPTVSPTEKPSPSPTVSPSLTPSPSPTPTPEPLPSPPPTPFASDAGSDGPALKLDLPLSRCVFFSKRDLPRCSWWNALEPRLTHLIVCNRNVSFKNTDDIVGSGIWIRQKECGFLDSLVQHERWPKICSVAADSELGFCHVQALLPK